MPRHRMAEQPDGTTALTPMAERSKADELLQWVAERISVRNANGALTQRFCVLCGEARRRRERCRHGEIYAHLNG